MRRHRRDSRHTVRPAASVLHVQELSVGDPAPDLVLLDAAERPVFLSALWRERPLVLIFLRHFG
jgi:hypothetical protein